MSVAKYKKRTSKAREHTPRQEDIAQRIIANRVILKAGAKRGKKLKQLIKAYHTVMSDVIQQNHPVHVASFIGTEFYIQDLLKEQRELKDEMNLKAQIQALLKKEYSGLY